MQSSGMRQLSLDVLFSGNIRFAHADPTNHPQHTELGILGGISPEAFERASA